MLLNFGTSNFYTLLSWFLMNHKALQLLRESEELENEKGEQKIEMWLWDRFWEKLIKK